jgi:N-acyl-L-homoserine lactone synthetase
MDIEFFKPQERPDLAALCWRLRHRVFKENMHWDIPTIDMLDIDEFDLNSIHCAALLDGKLVGCWRALRTDKPYLLEKYFDQFKGAYRYPKSSRIWEVSRFAIEPEIRQRRRVGIALAHAFVEFGFRQDAFEIIGITEPQFEMFLSRSGLLLKTVAGPELVGKSGDKPVYAVITSCPIIPQNIEAASSGLYSLAA